jgi:uncharacterized glyoxalase superfamily protein PhnB
MIRACSHLVIAARDVEAMAAFFRTLFVVEPHFTNREFAEFVLPSRFRVAFFRVVGATKKYFGDAGSRDHVAFGVTVDDVDAIYTRAISIDGVTTSGPPKEHPWGEKSFLLIDPEGNRWEIAQTPSADGMLVNRE